jgi:hypothetical protein
VTFYLDENLPPRIAEMLRARGVDAVSAHEAPGNIQLDDRSQLLYAADASRAILVAHLTAPGARSRFDRSRGV